MILALLSFLIFVFWYSDLFSRVYLLVKSNYILLHFVAKLAILMSKNREKFMGIYIFTGNPVIKSLIFCIPIYVLALRGNHGWSAHFNGSKIENSLFLVTGRTIVETICKAKLPILTIYSWALSIFSSMCWDIPPSYSNNLNLWIHF